MLDVANKMKIAIVAWYNDCVKGYVVEGKLNKYCVDCEKKVSRLGTKRCQKCYGKTVSQRQKGRRLHPNTIKAITGKRHWNWKGEIKGTNGYILVKNPKHPNSQKNGYILKHRLVMSTYIGRPLRTNEVVHHIDGNKENNSINNLHLFSSHKEHLKHEHLNGKKFSHKNT